MSVKKLHIRADTRFTAFRKSMGRIAALVHYVSEKNEVLLDSTVLCQKDLEIEEERGVTI